MGVVTASGSTMFFMKFKAYAREAAFIFAAAPDTTSRIRLLWHTVRFHLFNAFQHTQVRNSSFSATLKIDHSYVARLNLRPFAGDLFVLYEVLLDRCYFIPDSLAAPENVRVIVDCGANVGITALYFASRYPKAKIYCIEPHPDNFEILKRNTQSEVRIVPIHAAVVGLPAATVRLSINEPAWGNKLSNSEAGIDVPAITIPQLCTRYGFEFIDLLKVDIEGAEEIVFAHAEFLSRVKAGVIELHGHYSRQQFDIDLSKWGLISHSPQPEIGVKMLTFGQTNHSNSASPTHDQDIFRH